MNRNTPHPAAWIRMLIISAVFILLPVRPVRILAYGSDPLPVKQAADMNEDENVWNISLNQESTSGKTSFPDGASGSKTSSHTHVGSFLIAGLAAMAAGSAHYCKSRQKNQNLSKNNRESESDL